MATDLLKYIVPRIPRNELTAVVGYSLTGAVISGSSGILHDQLTFAIGPEYFYRFKFQQFAWADFGLGDRIFVSTIGFLATWWAGLIVGWILSRRCLPNQSRGAVRRQILVGFGIVFSTAVVFGIIGWVYGLWRGPAADYSAWQSAFSRYRVTDQWAFMRVAYIHNAGYAGGLVGLLLTYVVVRPAKVHKTEGHDKTEKLP